MLGAKAFVMVQTNTAIVDDKTARIAVTESGHD
jgi:hypothetical protein